MDDIVAATKQHYTYTEGKRVTRITNVMHPLDCLTESEIAAGRAILEREGLIGEGTRFPLVMPVEPPKDYVLAWKPGQPMDRRIRFTLIDLSTGISREVVVSVTDDSLVSNSVLSTDKFPYGQPPYLFEEYKKVEAIVKNDPQWQEAMRRRGVTDFARAWCSPLAPGYYDFEEEHGARVMRALTYVRSDMDDGPYTHPWFHPVEGLLVTVNLTTGKVLRIVDEEHDTPIPQIDSSFGSEYKGKPRTSLKPLEITQPEGPSFIVDGSHVQWENWKFRIGFDMREGLVLHQVSFRDGGQDRSVLYRASIPEMIVPYGDSAVTRNWINYFDSGEYLLGKNANSLALGCDCLGVIHYFDAVIASDHDGRPRVIPQAICMHEEDFGIQWKHVSLYGDHSDVRRMRRLVVSYISTIGNYDYGFYWYFYLDGSIQVEAKATGMVFTAAGRPGGAKAHTVEIAPGLFAPLHQHLFCARLDVAIDGQRNSVDEVDVVTTPKGPNNPHANAFDLAKTRLRTEADGKRMADGLKGRTWHITSGERRNYVGYPTAYVLSPQSSQPLLAHPDASVSKRANFATQHLWVTRYDDGELWAAGPYPSQHAGYAGLPEMVAKNRGIENTDIVLWHTFGMTHVPTPEEFPVMSADRTGFWLRPFGFLDKNPTLDLPDPNQEDCCAS